MIGFVLFTRHMFSSYRFWVNLIFILWFFHNIPLTENWFCTLPSEQMVPDLRERKHCWWFIFWMKKPSSFDTKPSLKHSNHQQSNYFFLSRTFQTIWCPEACHGHQAAGLIFLKSFLTTKDNVDAFLNQTLFSKIAEYKIIEAWCR